MSLFVLGGVFFWFGADGQKCQSFFHLSKLETTAKRVTVAFAYFYFKSCLVGLTNIGCWSENYCCRYSVYTG